MLILLPWAQSAVSRQPHSGATVAVVSWRKAEFTSLSEYLLALAWWSLGVAWLVAWHSGRTSENWPENFPCPALDLQLMGDH